MSMMKILSFVLESSIILEAAVCTGDPLISQEGKC